MRPLNVGIKVFFALLGLFAIFQIGKCVYQVAFISCTIPPIKTYEYFGSKKQFEAGLRKYVNNNPNIEYRFIDSVGDIQAGFAYDFGIKDSITNDSAGMRYEVFHKSDVKKVKIELISLFGTKPFRGGYGVKADGMDTLLTNFQNYFIIPLNKQQHIFLTTEE